MKKITVKSKRLGDKEATVKVHELWGLVPAFDDYDDSFDCVYQRQLGDLRDVLSFEYDKMHAHEKMRIEAGLQEELSDDPEDDFSPAWLKYSEYGNKRRAWVGAKISDSAFFMRRFNDMFAEPDKYGEFTEILSINED